MNTNQKVITRFAPSPTGNLHIGGARTALFNWLFSKNQKGKFLLRIEDTDVERSKDEYYKQIISTLKWLEINWDEEPYIQSKNIQSHINVANDLLKNGHAYKCYCTEIELEKEKKLFLEKKIPYTYNRKCRNIFENITNKPFVIRFKSKIEGKTILRDLVQGDVEINNSTIEDFVILRKDNKPTYNLSATVDDYQMKISHVIRGDDHKINAFKQIQIFESMGWEMPRYAHIPLIHSQEGKKLSKRDDASTVED
ncbi:MAG: glutamate--tRNA ligase, partial [Candidatus Fonsibacter sp.]|nr:glutamate--tRNA ligase [Candidatus Fonsibacter sp.]